MTDLITALAHLRAFRSTWNNDDLIGEESGLTAADLDTILAAADEPDDAELSGPLNGGSLDGLI